MGSYLTVVNDTEYEWKCKVGLDQAALKMTVTASSILTPIITVLGSLPTLGASAPFIAAVGASGAIVISGLALPALEPILTDVGGTDKTIMVSNSISKFSQAVANAVNKSLGGKGFQTIRPDERNRYGKMTLSLWQQSTCVRVELRDTATAVIHTLYMRPIFSGSTANSNRNHSISWWENEKGTELIEIKGVVGN